MSRDAQLYLNDIINSCRNILIYVQDLNFENFSKDKKTFDAVIYNLQIIGEAAKHLPNSVCEQLPNLEWKEIKGLRDVIVHEYFGLDNDIIWDILQNNIPYLLNTLQQFRYTKD